MYLGRQDRQHGITAPQDLSSSPESQICTRQDDAGIYHGAPHVGTSLLCDLHGHHAAVQDNQVVHL